MNHDEPNRSGASSGTTVVNLRISHPKRVHPPCPKNLQGTLQSYRLPDGGVSSLALWLRKGPKKRNGGTVGLLLFIMDPKIPYA